MAFWLLAIPAVYAAKKIYDYTTRDEVVVNSKKSSLSYQKGIRSKYRKKVIGSLVNKNRSNWISGLKDDLETNYNVGEVLISNDESTEYLIDFVGLDKAFKALSEASSILIDGPNISVGLVEKEILLFTPVSDLKISISGYARKEYGDMAGIDDDSEKYSADQDPFLNNLKAAKSYLDK